MIFLFIIPIFLFIFSKKRRLFYILYLLLYSLLLFFGVLLEVKIYNHIITFSLTITEAWFDKNISLAFFDPLSILINLFLLFPYGVIIPKLTYKRQLIKVIITCIVVSIYIEFLQFSLPIKRSCELLDILNNLISGILGYLYYLLLRKIRYRSELDDKLSKQKNSKT